MAFRLSLAVRPRCDLQTSEWDQSPPTDYECLSRASLAARTHRRVHGSRALSTDGRWERSSRSQRSDSSGWHEHAKRWC